jgi:Flp pilus assembly protein TadG
MIAFRRSVRNALGNYLRRTGGNVTMITALSIVPLAAVAGAALDYANINRDITAFQNAADSAVLAVTASDKARITGLTGSALAARMAELDKIATDYIAANYVPRNGHDPDFTLSLAIDGQKVKLTAVHKVELTWLGALGIQGPNVTIVSEVKKAARPVELVMVMDTTGSMGTTYMAQARTAAKNLLQKLYGGTLAQQPDSEYIRIGLVPFSAAVRLDTSAYDYDPNWIDTTGAAPVSKLNFSDPTWHNYMAWSKLRTTTGASIPWNGCVEARYGNYAIDDTPPSSGSTLFTPYFAPDEPAVSSGYYNNYITGSGSPNETTNIATTSSPTNWGSTYSCSGFSSSSTTTTSLSCRQNNVNKYVNKQISPESSSQYGPWFNCAASKIVPLTYSRARVEAGIDAMSAQGSTVIPEGMAWGWRVLSPTEPFTKVEGSTNQAASTIAPYDSPRWQKIMVLMTDGENDVLSNGSQVNALNGTWYSSYGRGKAALSGGYNRFGTTTISSIGPALDDKLTTLCNSVKAAGITIYTVAFRVTAPVIQNRLKACASGDDKYSYAADGVALAAIFNHIGENVANTNISLSK